MGQVDKHPPERSKHPMIRLDYCVLAFDNARLLVTFDQKEIET